MPATITPIEDANFGSMMANVYEFAADDSYPADGYVVTAGSFGLHALELVLLEAPMCPVSDDGYGFAYDRTAGTIKVFRGGALGNQAFAEVPVGTDLSDWSTRLVAIGR